MKKVVIFNLILLVGLTLLGLGYAWWSKTLTTQGKVSTGEVDWEFEGGTFNCKDPIVPPTNDWNCDFGFLNIRQVDKNVGGTIGVFEDPDGDGDFDTLKVTFDNVYPCYYEHITFWVRCNGSMPIIIKKVIIDGHEFTGLPSYVTLDLNGDGKNDVEIRYGDNFGAQLDPGISADMSFDIHVLQDAPQCESLSFTIEIVAGQWNM